MWPILVEGDPVGPQYQRVGRRRRVESKRHSGTVPHMSRELGSASCHRSCSLGIGTQFLHHHTPDAYLCLPPCLRAAAVLGIQGLETALPWGIRRGVTQEQEAYPHQWHHDSKRAQPSPWCQGPCDAAGFHHRRGSRHGGPFSGRWASSLY